MRIRQFATALALTCALTPAVGFASAEAASATPSKGSGATALSTRYGPYNASMCAYYANLWRAQGYTAVCWRDQSGYDKYWLIVY